MTDKGYTILSNSILEDENLSLIEQSLIIAILSYFNKEKGFSYPSYNQLKKRSKIVDNRTMLKNINSLIEKGYIRKETLKGQGCRYYILKPSGELHLVENYTTCNNTLPPSGELHYDLVENYTTTNTNTNTNTNINKKNSHISKDIEYIWSLYPNKKGKVIAARSIKKILKSISLEELELCINRYIQYVENERINGFKTLKYKNGSTFFNTGYLDYLDNNYINGQEYKKNISKTLSIALSDKEILGEAY